MSTCYSHPLPQPQTVSNSPAATLLSGTVQDLAEWLGAAWAVAATIRDRETHQVLICGAPPDRRTCLDYIWSLTRRTKAAGPAWQLHIAAEEANHRLPRVITWSAQDDGAIALAFGPKITGEAYTVSDCALILDAASQFSALLERKNLARCVARTASKMRSLCGELSAMAGFQRRSLSVSLPRFEGLDYYGESLPADGIAGDFFDFIAPGNESLAIAVGDVAGGGSGSALFLTGLQGFVRNLTAEKRSDTGAVISELNRVSTDLSPERFVARLFYAQIDPALHRLRYVNAGHEPALLIRANMTTVELLENTGTVLGLTYKSSYSTRTFAIRPGDVLVACSEGLCERLEADSRGFVNGVLSAVRSTPGIRARDLAKKILGSSSPADEPDGLDRDRTVVIVRVTETATQTVSTSREFDLVPA